MFEIAYIRVELMRLYDLLEKEDKNSIAYSGLLAQIVYFENRLQAEKDKLKSFTRIEWQKENNRFD